MPIDFGRNPWSMSMFDYAQFEKRMFASEYDRQLGKSMYFQPAAPAAATPAMP
jgi:hypothetical protein